MRGRHSAGALLLASALAALPCAGGAADAGGLEERVGRLERILGGDTLADILLQIQRLQQEVQQLRGELEVQSHALESLSRRQRDLYLDIDRRLSGRQGIEAAPSEVPTDEAPRIEPEVPAVAPGLAPAEAPPIPAGDPVQEEGAYRAAFNLLQERRYDESMAAFQRFLEQYPGGRYADNAQYWLGEANYVNRNFETAMAEFGKVLERYPDSGKVPGAMLKIGYIHYELKQWKQAREMLTRLTEAYPQSTEASLAAARLERMRQMRH